MIKKNTLLIAILTITFSFFQNSITAQVGINTVSPLDGSILDVTSDEKGILIPRLDIDDLSTADPVTGGITTSMLAYNTNSTTGIGYFYWDGSVWVPVGTGKFWGHNGDAGTTPGTASGEDFIGTSDDQDLIMARNNQERLQLTTTTSVINEAGNDIDFRVESDDQTNMIFVNAAEDQVFVRNSAHHIPSYIDPFNAYANSLDDGTATVGIQYAIAGWNQGTLGGGINGVIEDVTNGYAAIEGSTAAAGAAVKGLSVTNSNAYGVFGTIPTTGPWLGFGGLFTGGLGYSGGVYNVSDARVKKDIVLIDNALSKIMNIDGVSYQYDYSKFTDSPRVDTSTYYGFTAQNVKQQLPHAVVEKYIPIENTENRSLEEKALLNVVDYTAVIPVLVEAMKEQQQIIESQNQKIAALQIAVSEIQKKD